jgi:hypothetical protein
VLYAVVSEQLEPFLRHAKETYARPLPKYVEKELLGRGAQQRGQSIGQGERA